jgi:hypothetical protein
VSRKFSLLDELLLVAFKRLLLWASNDLGSPDSLLFDARQTSGKDGLTDEGDWHTLVEGIDSSPLSGTLLTSSIKDLLNDGDTVSVGLSENVSGDLDQE